MKAIILTKSSMKAHGVSGVCTVAFDLESCKLVRLVSTPEGGPIPNPHNSRYDYFDIIDAPILKACPKPPQVENKLIDCNRIKLLNHFSGGIDQIYSLYQQSVKPSFSSLFMDDRYYRLEDVSVYNHSIEIIVVSNLVLSSSETGRTIASFNSEFGNLYSYFRVTDPDFKVIQGEPVVIGDAILVISIPYLGYITDSGENLGYFKFVAKVFRKK